MCGIYSFLNHKRQGLNFENIKTEFLKGKDRGPESSSTKVIDEYDVFIGFHRL